MGNTYLELEKDALRARKSFLLVGTVGALRWARTFHQENGPLGPLQALQQVARLIHATARLDTPVGVPWVPFRAPHRTVSERGLTGLFALGFLNSVV